MGGTPAKYAGDRIFDTPQRGSTRMVDLAASTRLQHDAGERVVRNAERTAESGDVRRAIRILNEANRSNPSTVIELALVQLRHAFYASAVDTPRSVPPLRPDASPASFRLVDGIPHVTRDELSATALHAAIETHGCLIVRELVPATTVDRLVEGIDRAFEALDAWTSSSRDVRPGASRWFAPFTPDAVYGARALGGRAFTRSTGGIWAVESPRMLFEVLELLDDLGLHAIIEDYMGEAPALSAAKCNIRRTPVDVPGGWHQDGSFIGTDVCTIDVWMSLSHCGVDAPGLDLVPARVDHLLPTGLDRVVIADDDVQAAIAGLPGVEIKSPVFAPGDVVLFDHLFVHRTAVNASMTKNRYAIESWFFAPSRYPGGQIPLLY